MESTLDILLAVLVVEMLLFWLGPADWGMAGHADREEQGRSRT